MRHVPLFSASPFKMTRSEKERKKNTDDEDHHGDSFVLRGTEWRQCQRLETNAAMKKDNRKEGSSREGYSGEKEDVFQRTMRCKNNSKFSKTERRRESTRLALKSDSLFRRQQLLCISFGRDYAAMSPIEAYHQLSYSLDAIVGIETLQPAIPLGSTSREVAFIHLYRSWWRYFLFCSLTCWLLLKLFYLQVFCFCQLDCRLCSILGFT